MPDINFAPSAHPRRKHEQRESIAYSSGTTQPVSARQPAPVQRPAPKVTPAAPLQAAKPAAPQLAPKQKQHSFFAWRKKRNGGAAPVVPQNPVPHASQQAVLNAAPNLASEQHQPALQHMPKHIMPSHATPPPLTPHVPAARPTHQLVDSLPITEVNLIPDVALNELTHRNPSRDLGLVAAVMVVVVLLVFGAFTLYERKITADTAAVETDIQTLNNDIAAFTHTQSNAQYIGTRLAALDQVMRAHVYWTPFLTTVEGLTLPTVYYTTMTGSASTGIFTFTAVAKSYNQIAPQVAVFRNAPLVSDVTVSSIQLFQPATVIGNASADQAQSNGVSFKLTVTFAPDIFIHSQLRSYVQP